MFWLVDLLLTGSHTILWTKITISTPGPARKFHRTMCPAMRKYLSDRGDFCLTCPADRQTFVNTFWATGAVLFSQEVKTGNDLDRKCQLRQGNQTFVVLNFHDYYNYLYCYCCYCFFFFLFFFFFLLLLIMMPFAVVTAVVVNDDNNDGSGCYCLWWCWWCCCCC